VIAAGREFVGARGAFLDGYAEAAAHGLLATIVIVSRAPVSSAGPLRVVTPM